MISVLINSFLQYNLLIRSLLIISQNFYGAVLGAAQHLSVEEIYHAAELENQFLFVARGQETADLNFFLAGLNRDVSRIPGVRGMIDEYPGKETFEYIGVLKLCVSFFNPHFGISKGHDFLPVGTSDAVVQGKGQSSQLNAGKGQNNPITL